MEKNSGNFSVEDVMRMASTPTGQRLLALLRQSGGEDLRRAAKQADVDALKKQLAPLLSSPEVRALMQQLEKNHG